MHRDEVTADLAQTYGLYPPYEGKVSCSTLCVLVAQLGPGTRLSISVNGGNAGRSFAELVAAATYNQLKTMCWDGKGPKPELIDIGQNQADKRTERYGKGVTTALLVQLMGDHIVR